MNDGGADIAPVAHAYADDFSVQIVNNEVSQGGAQALNDGVAVSRGMYIAVLDDDDVAYPLHLETLFRCADTPHSRRFVYSMYNRTLISGRGDEASVVARTHPKLWSFSRRELLIANRPPIHTWLVPQSVFAEHHGFDPQYSIVPDWDFLLRVTKNHALWSVPCETCEYRLYVDLSNSVTKGRRQVVEEMRTIYENHPAESRLVDLARRLQIAEVELQVAYATRLEADVQRGHITRDVAGRQYIGDVFGL